MVSFELPSSLPEKNAASLEMEQNTHLPKIQANKRTDRNSPSYFNS